MDTPKQSREESSLARSHTSPLLACSAATVFSLCMRDLVTSGGSGASGSSPSAGATGAKRRTTGWCGYSVGNLPLRPEETVITKQRISGNHPPRTQHSDPQVVHACYWRVQPCPAIDYGPGITHHETQSSMP